MTTSGSLPFCIRPARAEDLAVIRSLVWASRVNPLGIRWARFVVAIDPAAQVIGCGQVKPHQDGSRELASLVVHPGWRGQGVGGTIIRELVARHPGTLFLMCRAALESFYQQFGFVAVTDAHMPRYFRRIKRLSRVFEILLRDEGGLLVMRRS